MWWMTLFPDSFSWTFPRLFHRTDRVGHVSWPCWASNFSEWRLPVLFAQKDQQWNDNLNSPVIHIRNPAFGKPEEQRLVRVEEFQGYSVQVFMSDCLFKWRMNRVARDRPDSRLWENPASLILLPAMKDFTCMIEEMMESGEKYLVTSAFISFF